ncbi:winged helix-turn-helix transcriptional regulator [Halorubellus sp. JP-L1]|uniref:ArsR/SmtB family transcription factor n=1 Tax=Halorubellus sp. JP-L1 TaxID=2715753 RepID=UPI00140D437F|nr:winged helix-turn-helix domain-containing protein [Halorubellus sp. JP-L1]NHN42193.1 winged helix-turn-helix transcriptional regulator [Halorubellus sp. JP-L1]
MADDSVSDAFAALGDATRVAILEALVDERRENPTDPGLSFSALRERVGVADSGRFNYHLGKLRGQFVELDDGTYSLTDVGNEVVGAILAGTYDDAADLEPTGLGDDCPLCERELSARFEDGVLTVECDDEHSLLVTTVPPAAVADRTVAELVAFAVRTTYARLDLVTAGICSECYGPVDATVDATDADDDALPEYGYRTTCRRCGYTTRSAAAVAALREPAFVSFCHDHGVNIRDRLPWTLPGIVDGETLQVADDPPRYKARIELDGDVLVLELDGEGEVVDATRERTE